MDTKKIGRLIARRRKELGMTQQALADKLTVTNKAVSKWETGQGVPDVSLLKNLASLLQISVDELLDGEKMEYDIESHEDYEDILITKKDYFQYIKEKHFHNKILRGILFLVGIFCCAGGIALKEAYHYLYHHLDILGIVLLICGVLILVGLGFSKYVFKALFQEKKVSYILNHEGILYQDHGNEDMFYYNQLSLMYVLEDKIVLTVNKQQLWIDKKDLEVFKHQAKHLIDQTSSSYQRKQWVAFVGLGTVFILCACLLLGYYVVLKRLGFEMIFDEWNGVIWVLMILCGSYSFIIWHSQRILVMVMVAVITLLASWFIGKTLSLQRTIYSLSPNLLHQLVLKQNKDNGKLSDYHYTFLCFAKKSNTMNCDQSKKISTQWISNDCNIVSYTNNHQKEVFVATYGDRGNGISYYNVAGSMQGNWIRKNDNDENYKMKVEDQGITIKYNQHTDTFTYANMQQNGTIALTLYDTYQHPKYVIVMNENCSLNQDYLLKNDGTIQLIDLDEQTSVELFCTTYKEDAEVQQQIDNQMEESAKNLVKKMQNILKQDSSLTHYQSTYDIFKVETSSQDFFEVVRLAYQKDIGEKIGIADYKITDQIMKISIKAGTIQDFYVEVKADTMMEKKTTGKISKNGYIPNYRIMQGDDCYLVGRITYRVPGDVGLSPLIHPLIKDVSKDKTYRFQRES